MDRELKTLMQESKPYFKDNDFDKFLKAQKKYDKTPCIVDGTRVFQYQLRKTLGEIPSYFQSVEHSGLNYKQGLGLLMHLLEKDPYDFSDKRSDMIILGKALRASKQDETLSKNLSKIKKLTSAGVGGSGMGGSLYSLFITARLGLPLSESGQMIVNGTKGSYVIGPFNEALRSMLPAKPESNLVTEAFDIMYGNGNNYWNAGGYKLFKELMTFVAPSKNIPINNMLSLFISSSKSKSQQKRLEAMLEENSEKKDKSKNSNDEYFLKHKGRLEYFAQPYVIQRTLEQGIDDLKKLATASYYNWDETGEGMFVFDPEKELWYSLGGELELPSMGEVLSGTAERVRHRFISYDISKLSETPFLFHIHPEELDCFVSPKDRDMDRDVKDYLTKFITATPSRADYKVVAELMSDAKTKVKTRAFIAHCHGMTEFTYPDNIKDIEEMSKKSRDLRDQVFLKYNGLSPWQIKYIINESDEFNRLYFVKKLMNELNDILPQGFAVNLDSA